MNAPVNATVRNSPLIRDYLAELRGFLADVPADDAAELLAQVTEHLEDAMPMDATPAEVYELLMSLGTPSDLAAAARTSATALAAQPDHALGSAGRTLRTRRRRPRLRTLLIAAFMAILTVALSIVIVRQVRTGDLTCVCETSFADAIDREHQSYRRTFDSSEASAPIRLGVAQGVDVMLINRTGFTQTILGLPTKYQYGFTVLKVGTSGLSYDDTTDLRHAKLTTDLPISIPPGGVRWVELRLRPLACESPGAGTVITQVPLRVKVGWFERTEVVSLDGMGFSLLGDRDAECPRPGPAIQGSA